MNIVQSRLQGMSPRERSVLGFGIFGAALILIYSFVWQPWQDDLKRLRTQVPLKKETLQWMERQAELVQPLLKAPQSRASGQPLLTIVEQSANQSKISPYIRRMTPGEGDQVKIWLTEADFDRWVLWLERLRRFGIEVTEASINRAKNNTATIRVTLQR